MTIPDENAHKSKKKISFYIFIMSLFSSNSIQPKILWIFHWFTDKLFENSTLWFYQNIDSIERNRFASCIFLPQLTFDDWYYGWALIDVVI